MNYDISKEQLITLWVFGVLIWLWAAMDFDSYSPSDFSLPLFFLVPAGLTFYTLGWRRVHPSEKKAKAKVERHSDQPSKSLKGNGGYLKILFYGLVVQLFLQATTALLSLSSLVNLVSWWTADAEIFQLISYAFFTIFTLVAIYFFVEEDRRFPWIVSTLLIANLCSSIILVYLFADWGGGLLRFSDYDFEVELLTSAVPFYFIVACLAIPYVYLSERVRNTFIN